MNSNILTLRLDDKLKKRLQKMARSRRCSQTLLAAEAIRVYLAVNEWQVEETIKAVREANRGEFASDREVCKVMDKWRSR